MAIKIIIILLLLFILINLLRALLIMVSGKARERPMSHFLGRRVIFSILVLIIVIGAIKLGFLKTNHSPINVTVHKQTQINTARPHQQNANTKQPLEMQNVYLL